MTLTIVAVIFGIFAIGLIVLLIYKSTLTMHRDDQLFLDDASSHMHEEQTELLAKGQPAYHPDARVQHWVWGISDGALGDVALPEAERGTVASKAVTCVIRPTSSNSARRGGTLARHLGEAVGAQCGRRLVDCRRVTITRLLASKLSWRLAAKSCLPSNSSPI